MSKILALEYAEKVKKVSKGVIDAFEAGYKQKEKEYSKLSSNKSKTTSIRTIRKEIDNIKLDIGYSDLRGSAYEKEMNKINSILEENKIISTT